MLKNKFLLKKPILLAVVFLFALLSQLMLPSFIHQAKAASLTYGLVRFNRMNASQATTGTVCAKTNAASQTEAAVGVTFPTGYTVSTTLGNWSVDTTSTGWPPDPANDSTSATAWVSIAQPTSGQIVGQTVVFGSGNLAANTWYCFNWTNSAGLSIKSSATNNNTGIITTCNANTTNCAGLSTHTADLDTSNYATASVAASCGSVGCDQIAVTATVAPTFSFSLSSNTAALSTLSTGGTAATAINATVSTNAYRGWTMWAADPAGTPGLTSATAAHTIAYFPTVGSAAATLSAQEGYNLGAGTASGTTCNSVTTDSNFASSGTPYKGGGLDNTLRTIAVSDGVANACSLPLTVNAMIVATTPAATDYAGTMTVVAAGRF
jgi:hypothetical protein